MKKVLFAVLTIGLVVLTGELLAYVGLAVLYRDLAPGAVVAAHHRSVLAEAVASGNAKQDVIIHPYLGYVTNPNFTGPIKAPRYEYLSSASQGFYSEKSMVPFNREEVFSVALLGGSVAHYFALEMGKEVEAFFASFPENSGKEIRFFDLSNWAYKQPQQLMALEYLRSLGVTFDVVVNLDGFNEIATAFVMNAPRNVSIFMPGNWDLMAGAFPTKQATVLMGEKAFVHSLRGKLAAWVAGWPFGSNMVRLVWAGLDGLAVRAAARLDAALARENYAPRPTDAVIVSPSEKVYLNENFPQDERFLLSRAVSQWATASVQMHNTVVAEGGRYFHFLQPNQYAPDSKPFSRQEKEQFVSDANPAAPFARQGYPWLRAFGGILSKNGLLFSDLTQTYADIAETIYTDDCCHVNTRGNAMLLAAMREFIIRKWPERPKPLANIRPELDRAAAGMFPRAFVFDVLNDAGDGHLFWSGFGEVERNDEGAWIWGYGAESVITFYANAAVPAVLEVDLVNLFPGQMLSVTVNGEPVLSGQPCPTADGPFDKTHRVDVRPRFTTRFGTNTIRIRAGVWNEGGRLGAETRPFSVKFDTLRVRSVEER